MPGAALAVTSVFINELHYDNVGGDTGEAVEIAGPAGTDLTGWMIVLYNGNGGAPYDTINLSGTVPNQDNGYGALDFARSGIQNGSPDGLALVDNGGALVQFLCYEGSFVGVGGPANGISCDDIGVGEPGDTPIGYSLQLSGTGTTYEDFVWQTPMPNTFGTVNTAVGQSFGGVVNQPVLVVCGDTLRTYETNPVIRMVSASDADGTVGSMSISVSPEPTSGTISLQNFVAAGAVGGTATGDVVVDADVPAGVYEVTVTAVNDDVEPQEGTCSFNVDVDPFVTIPQIQGAGHISPYVDQYVATSGVVTAVAFDSYYVQDPVGDGNPETSDGLFVFKTGSKPNVGDLVLLIDRVEEFISGGADTGNLSTTEMAFPQITILSTGNPLPDPVVIGLSGRMPPNVDVISEDETPVNLQDVPGVFDPENDGIDFYESLEGMLVTVEDAVAVSAVRSFGNFSSEMFTLPNNGHPKIIEPNNARTDRGGINLDIGPDGYGDLNPERVQIQFDASDIRTGTLYPSTVPEINVGDWLGDVTGVMNYDFGNFEVRATKVIDITPAGLAPETTYLYGTQNNVTVASYNVLNLAGPAAGGGSDPDAAQRAKLAEQIVNNLGSPDVIALQEIQDNNGTDGGPGNTETDATQTLQALVDAIVAAGGPSYNFFDVAPDPPNSGGGVPGGNIRNAFLYNPGRVSLESFVSLTSDVLEAIGVSNPYAFEGSRKPLVGTFTFNGEEFMVVNNHLSSRSGSSPIFGGPQLFFQAAEDEREAQVGALNDYVDYLLGMDKDARVIVLGDFNTFEATDDLTVILPGTEDGKAIMKSLLNEIEDDNRYSFIFDGNSQVLDHMFATRSLLEDAEFDIVHVNVDFSRRRNDITASDHEPLVGRFNFK
jgi:predicted extracellular nuclease